jgi:hypothetical protein
MDSESDYIHSSTKQGIPCYAPTLYLGYTIYNKQVQLLCYFTYFNIAYFY